MQEVLFGVIILLSEYFASHVVCKMVVIPRHGCWSFGFSARKQEMGSNPISAGVALDRSNKLDEGLKPLVAGSFVHSCFSTSR
jgi:hypothetical protein